MKTHRKWGYVIVMSKFIVNLMGAGMAKSFGVILPDMVERFSQSHATMGFICTLPTTVMLFSGPFVSFILQWLDHRMAGMLGGLLSAVCVVSAGFVSDVWALGVALALTGIGRSFVYLPISIALNELFTDKYVLMNTIASYGITAGVIFFPVVTQWSQEAYGYQGTFMILGAIMLHMVAGAAAIAKPIQGGKNSKGKEPPIQYVLTKGNKQCGDANACGYPGLEGTRRQSTEDRVANASGKTLLENGHNHREDQNFVELNGLTKFVMDEDVGKCDESEEQVPLISQPPITAPEKESFSGEYKDNILSSSLSRCRTFFHQEILYLVCLPATFCHAYTFYVWVIFLIPHAEELSFAPSRAVSLALIGGVGGIVGRTIATLLLSKTIRMFSIYAFIGSTLSVSFYLDLVGDSFFVRSLMAFVQGVCFFILDTADAYFLKSVLTDNDNFSFGLGIRCFVYGVGNVLAGFVTGALYDVFQSYTIVFIMTGVVPTAFTINVVLIWMLVKRREKTCTS